MPQTRIRSSDQPPEVKHREHRVSIVVNGREVYDWLDYTIDSSIIEPADSFTMRRAFDWDAWDTCRRDARVRVLIDGTCMLDGFIEDREKSHAAGEMEIAGRDRVGRLVDESALRTRFDGLTLFDTAKQIVSPWFTSITASNARNRKVRRGKGVKAPTGKEPVYIPPRPKSGRIEPGQQKWQILERMVSQAGLIAWASADGKELFIGRPNYDQAPQYLVRVTAEGSAYQSTAIDLVYKESNANRYAMIIAIGSGASSSADYGENICAREDFVLDNEGDRQYGVGRDFLYPKTLITVENSLRDNAEASRIAGREQIRRDFNRTRATATMQHHGQIYQGQMMTLFAPDTVARVIDEEIELDEAFYVYACSYTSSREQGEQTRLDMVPQGTEITL